MPSWRHLRGHIGTTRIMKSSWSSYTVCTAGSSRARAGRMHVRQVLIVEYFFPPIGGVGSIRAALVAIYLPEFGCQATVLAPADTPLPRDASVFLGEVPVAWS